MPDTKPLGLCMQPSEFERNEPGEPAIIRGEGTCQKRKS